MKGIKDKPKKYVAKATKRAETKMVVTTPSTPPGFTLRLNSKSITAPPWVFGRCLPYLYAKKNRASKKVKRGA